MNGLKVWKLLRIKQFRCPATIIHQIWSNIRISKQRKVGRGNLSHFPGKVPFHIKIRLISQDAKAHAGADQACHNDKATKCLDHLPLAVIPGHPTDCHTANHQGNHGYPRIQNFVWDSLKRQQSETYRDGPQNPGMKTKHSGKLYLSYFLPYMKIVKSQSGPSHQHTQKRYSRKNIV